MFNYFFLMFCLIFSGFGAISLLLPKSSLSLRLSISPFITWMIWLWMYMIFVYFGDPLKNGIPCLTVVTILLMWIGLKNFSYPANKIIFYIILSIILPILLMKNVFSHGLTSTFGNFSFDGWRYSMGSYYIWDHSLYSKPTMVNPFNYYGFNIFNTEFRFSIGQTFLSALSWLEGNSGNAITAINLVEASFLATFFISTISLIKKYPVFWGISYYILLAASGWLYKLVVINNIDNLLTISFFPVIAALSKYAKTVNHITLFAIIGFLFGGIYYQYVEYLPLTMAALFLFIFHFYYHSHIHYKKMIIYLSIMVSVFVIFYWPFLKMIFNYFFKYQLGAALRGDIGGEIYYGMLNLIVYWTTYLRTAPFLLTSISLFLWIFFIIGIIRGFVNREYDWIIFGMISILGFAWMMHWFPYGAYKFLIAGLWINSLFIIEGLVYFTSKASLNKIIIQPLVVGIAITLLMQHSIYEENLYRNFNHITGLPAHISHFKKLATLQKITSNEYILIQAKNWPVNAMLVYFSNVGFKFVCSSKKTTPALCIKPTEEELKAQFILTDELNPSLQLIWHETPFYLYRISV